MPPDFHHLTSVPYFHSVIHGFGRVEGGGEGPMCTAAPVTLTNWLNSFCPSHLVVKHKSPSRFNHDLDKNGGVKMGSGRSFWECRLITYHTHKLCVSPWCVVQLSPVCRSQVRSRDAVRPGCLRWLFPPFPLTLQGMCLCNCNTPNFKR